MTKLADLALAVNDLKGTEKQYVTETYLTELKKWAQIIDDVETNENVLDKFPSEINHFQDIKKRFDEILLKIRGLNLAQVSTMEDLRTFVEDFSNSYFQNLINARTKIIAYNGVSSSSAASLRSLIKKAEQAQKSFEESFNENLQRQATGATRSLSKYYKDRIAELKKDDDNSSLVSPKIWLRKRNFWFWELVFISIVFICTYIFLLNKGWISGYEIQVALSKLLVLALISYQFIFAQKNYHTYAELLMKYEHRKVIADTITDFSSQEAKDTVLWENLITNAAKTLFSDIDSGHSKGGDDKTLVENVINQIPRNN